MEAAWLDALDSEDMKFYRSKSQRARERERGRDRSRKNGRDAERGLCSKKIAVLNKVF